MRAGSHPTAAAASSTVAVDVSNSNTRSSIPRSRKYAFTLSIAIPDASHHVWNSPSIANAQRTPKGVTRRSSAGGEPPTLGSVGDFYHVGEAGDGDVAVGEIVELRATGKRQAERNRKRCWFSGAPCGDGPAPARNR